MSLRLSGLLREELFVTVCNYTDAAQKFDLSRRTLRNVLTGMCEGVVCMCVWCACV